LDTWSATGAVAFGKDTPLTITSGTVTYSGSMIFSGNGSFHVTSGDLTGSFGTVGKPGDR
jgi:hypothetical protein